MRLFFGLALTMVMVMSVVLLPPVLAAPEQEQENEEEQFPEEECDKYGICELDNFLDPDSPNYDPDLADALEGTRFSSNTEADIEANEEDDLPFPGDSEYGSILRPDKGVIKVKAYQRIFTDLELNDNDDTLFAPTLFASDYCRLESLAAYYYAEGSWRQHWMVYCHDENQWGQGSWVWGVDMDAAFCNRYLNSGYVTTMITQTGVGPTWTVYLYDWIDSEWDYVEDASGTSQAPGGYGWDAWEEYNLADGDEWPDISEMRSYHLRVSMNGTVFYAASSLYAYEHDAMDGDCPYDYDMNENYYDWYVGP